VAAAAEPTPRVNGSSRRIEMAPIHSLTTLASRQVLRRCHQTTRAHKLIRCSDVDTCRIRHVCMSVCHDRSQLKSKILSVRDACIFRSGKRRVGFSTVRSSCIRRRLCVIQSHYYYTKISPPTQDKWENQVQGSLSLSLTYKSLNTGQPSTTALFFHSHQIVLLGFLQ